MTKNSNINFEKFILIFCSIGLFPIALSYGLVPEKTLTPLFGIATDNVNLVHIMRAVMCLYFSQITFWIIGIIKPKMRLAALYDLTFFMFGLAFGRLLSFAVDGKPHWLLILYVVLELLFGFLGLITVRKNS